MACNDPELGKLIGSYELNLLTDEERKRFEDHVVTCDDCLKDLYRMAPVVRGMLSGKAVQTRPEGRVSVCDGQTNCRGGVERAVGQIF